MPDDIFSESSSKGSDSDDTEWVKVDKTPTLRQFTENPGVKQILSHPTEVSETVDLISGDSFFDMLCLETNRYYLQNHKKYDSNYKALKWVDVTSANMGKNFCNYLSNEAYKEG
jgi:hypothetical protein